MLSQTAEYALRAAVHLGESTGRPCTTREIAEATQVPGGYLSKVLQALIRAGIVRSRRGLHGGFRLGRPPDKISVYDVIHGVDPFRRIHTCPLDIPEHAEHLCPLHQRLDDAMASIEESFRTTSIAQVIAERAADQARTLCVAVNGDPRKPQCDGRCRKPSCEWKDT